MKISYVLATEKPQYCCETVLKSILDLPSHQKEIIVVSSNPVYAENKEVKFIFDDKHCGCVYSYNIGYKAVTGDWIVVLTDDQSLPENFLDCFKEIESEDFKKLTIHVGQLLPQFWGPGKDIWHKSIETPGYNGEHYPITETISRDNPIQTPYQTLNFPISLTEDVIKYLDGVCFNESFIHHYPDHWLGCYVEYINGCQSFWPKEVWLKQLCEFDRMVSKRDYDYYDVAILNKLRNKLYTENINYNYKVKI